MSDTFVAESTRQDANRGSNGQTTGQMADQGSGQAQRPQQSQRREGSHESSGRSTGQQQAMTPRVDVIEDTTGITLVADMPGVSRIRSRSGLKATHC